MDAHALIVGIAAYPKMPKLAKTLQDARGIYGVLTDPQYCGYPASQVTLLEDGAATQAAILGELDGLAGRAKIETCFIYFAGHAARHLAGPHAGEYLLPYESDLSSDDTLAQTGITGRVFSEKLQKIQSRQMVIVLDCCHAAGLVEMRGDVRAGLSEQFQTELARGNGRAVFAAARPDESSFERAEDNNGLFTRHLLDGLRGAAGSANDQFIRIFNLFAYVQPRVTADEARQHPVFKVEVEENFPLAMCAGGRGKGPVPGNEPPLSTYSRETILALLYRLLPTQFDELIFRLNMPPQLEPPIYLTLGLRAMAVVRWAEQPESGTSLASLAQKVRSILS